MKGSSSFLFVGLILILQIVLFSGEGTSNQNYKNPCMASDRMGKPGEESKVFFPPDLPPKGFWKLHLFLPFSMYCFFFFYFAFAFLPWLFFFFQKVLRNFFFFLFVKTKLKTYYHIFFLKKIFISSTVVSSTGFLYSVYWTTSNPCFGAKVFNNGNTFGRGYDKGIRPCNMP